MRFECGPLWPYLIRHRPPTTVSPSIGHTLSSMRLIISATPLRGRSCYLRSLAPPAEELDRARGRRSSLTQCLSPPDDAPPKAPIDPTPSPSSPTRHQTLPELATLIGLRANQLKTVARNDDCAKTTSIGQSTTYSSTPAIATIFLGVLLVQSAAGRSDEIR